jgi:uncharacterized protein (DUF169 family)
MSNSSLKEILALEREPVGITFFDTVPADLPRVDRQAVSSCAYWAAAAAGKTFYTLPEDLFGCPIGAVVHGLQLPPSLMTELQTTLQTMLTLDYLRPDEPAALPRVQRSYQAVVFSPLSSMMVPADVVIVIGKATTLMTLREAAARIDLLADTVTGRPSCGMIPRVLDTQRAVTNLGCVGNRVYTGIGADEFYFAFPGRKLPELMESLQLIQRANQELKNYHQSRLLAVV